MDQWIKYISFLIALITFLQKNWQNLILIKLDFPDVRVLKKMPIVF